MYGILFKFHVEMKAIARRLSKQWTTAWLLLDQPNNHLNFHSLCNTHVNERLREIFLKNLCNHAGLSAWLDTNKGADRHEAHSAISCWSHDLWMSNSANLNKNRIRIDLSFRPSLCLLFCLCLQTPVIKTDNCLYSSTDIIIE